MRYIKVTWVHDFEDEASQYFHELDDYNYETRKIMIYKNGTIEKVSDQLSDENSYLSPEPLPSIEEINNDNQFIAKEILKEEFERLWLGLDA